MFIAAHGYPFNVVYANLIVMVLELSAPPNGHFHPTLIELRNQIVANGIKAGKEKSVDNSYKKFKSVLEETIKE